MSSNDIDNRNLDHAIAIVGMYARVPGADGLEAFWSNLEHGVSSITQFTDEELLAAGVDPHLLQNPDYVKASGRLDGIEQFDASFFDMNPREAEILDPQHRILMEGVWRALEHAGLDPHRYPGRIALFAGVGFNGYLLHNILSNPSVVDQSGAWQLSISNDKDFAPTRIAYKLNLQGPAISVNTACSTSLVATAMAASSLLNHQCDTAIAGGCSLNLPQDEGYVHVPGGTLSIDGTCRPFDINASGTVDGNGTACVVLKRYHDAVADGDTIYAVITGFAINNDGSQKVGYTAPGVAGQADVILEAMQMAGVTANDINYVETHGTATELGDTVEISALREAFAASGGSSSTCYLGSVKSNIGHLDTAAGAAGLIKAVMAINKGTIPPTCNFERPNPLLDLESTSFRVNSQSIGWPTKLHMPRRAGVSSFGIGGTNAHVVVEQAPGAIGVTDASSKFTADRSTKRDGSEIVLIPLSAKSPKALAQLLIELREHIIKHPDLPLRDMAYTLQQGRSRFEYRAAVAVHSDQRSKLVDMLGIISDELNVHISNRTKGEPIRNIISQLCLKHSSSDMGEKWVASCQEWLAGNEPDWSVVGSIGNKIALPGHPFLKERYWIDPPKKLQASGAAFDTPSKSEKKQLQKIEAIDQWFYLPSWHYGIPTLKKDALKAKWLVCGSGSDVELQLVEDLRTHGADVVHVEQSLFHDQMEWKQVLQDLGDWKPDKIVLLGIDDSNQSGLPASSYLRLFAHTMDFASALQKTYFSEDIEVIVAASDLLEYDVADRSVVLGPLKVLPQECPNVSTRFVDVDGTSTRSALLCALTSTPAGSSVLVRGNGMQTATFTAIAQPLPNSGSTLIRNGGTYLITGGLGDIGLALARHLTAKHQAKMVLTTRSELPHRDQWETLSSGNDPIGRRLLQLMELESLGAHIEVVVADASDEKAMQALINDTIRDHGRIDGIIHAAGLVGEASFVTIAESPTDSGRQQNERQFFPKTHGLDALERVLSGKDFDFCMVCSSLSPILGGLGFSAYAATNAYVDAKVALLNQKQPGRWISVNWEGWMFDHDAVLASGTNSSAAELGMLPSEGVAVFEQIMQMPLVERVVISSGDLNLRLDQWINKTVMETAPAASGASHPRPDHIGAYTAPSTETETRLTELWEQLLGIQGIGIHDSFFELGGNSLLLTQLVALIRRHFKSELTLSALFEQPTIAEMAKGIDASNQPHDEDDREEGFI